jgi:hypothetical protein
MCAQEREIGTIYINQLYNYTSSIVLKVKIFEFRIMFNTIR